ncbi:ion transporter, partial [Eubacterium aggregans]|uniref:ion transporter n=1 Tax=Eubacterium aggregans TaxID=81409 RepID=UPI003F3CA5A1
IAILLAGAIAIININRGAGDDYLSRLYDIFIMIVAFLSIVPMMFKAMTPVLSLIDTVTVYILFADYVFRWIAADYTTGKLGWRVFVRYPFTIFAILDIISILPSLSLLPQSLMILRLFRIFKVLRYSKTFQYIARVFKAEKETLGYVLIIALAYIFLSALVMFNYEPDTFNHFFDALYWATTAMTTVGYGDIYPVSIVGKFISMVSSLFGIAVIAMPAGIVTAGFMNVFNEDREKTEQRENESKDD